MALSCTPYKTNTRQHKVKSLMLSKIKLILLAKFNSVAGKLGRVCTDIILEFNILGPETYPGLNVECINVRLMWIC